MMIIRNWKLVCGATCLLFSLYTGFVNAASLSQSAPPIGRWVGESSGDQISLSQNGKCSVSGTINVQGTCKWQATSAGGVLALKYTHVLPMPAYIYYNVTWIDTSTLLINGVEKFRRQ